MESSIKGEENVGVLVDEAQKELLQSDDETISTEGVVEWIEARTGRVLTLEDTRAVIRALSDHPRLIVEALGPALWKRGYNPTGSVGSSIDRP